MPVDVRWWPRAVLVAFVVAFVVGGGAGTRAFAKDHGAKGHPKGGGSPATVEQLAEQATGAYRLGDYNRAVELLERAYAMQPLTAILYNLAKAKDKLGLTDRAAELYQKYVVADDADPVLKQKAETRLTAMGKPLTPPKPDRAPTLTQPENPPPRTDTPPRTDNTAQQDVNLLPPPTLADDPLAKPKRERRRDLALGATFEVLALGGAVTAIVLGVAALDLQNQFNQSLDETQKRQLRDQARSYAIGVDVSIPVAAVCAGLGGWLLWRGTRPLPPSPKAARLDWLGPSVIQGGAMIVGGGRF